MSFRADKIYVLWAALTRKNYLCNQQVVDLKRSRQGAGTAVAIPPADVADAVRVMFP